MNTDQKQARGKHDVLTERIIGFFYDVYNEVGDGFLGVVEREGMRIGLIEAGLKVDTEVSIPVRFRGSVVGVFRADLIVNDVVLIELKACDQMIRQHESQTMHYLKATQIEVGLLMNFGPAPRFKRFVMDNELKQSKLKSLESVTIGVRPSTSIESV